MKTVSRKAQKENTRTNLIRQAEILFADNGISSTSTAEIAKSLHLSHGTLFTHFKTRDDLVRAVVEDFGERLSLALGNRLEENLKLKDLLKAHLSVLADFEDFYLRLIAEMQALPPYIRSIVYALNASLSYRFYRAAKKEQIKAMTQVQFFNTWMGLVHYTILNRDLFSDKKPALSETGDEMVRHFLHLIKT
jgi:AcrR family transcriptional regulator